MNLEELKKEVERLDKSNTHLMRTVMEVSFDNAKKTQEIADLIQQKDILISKIELLREGLIPEKVAQRLLNKANGRHF